MKKIFVFILAFVYLFVASGIAINTHYCMGIVESVNLFDHSADNCGKCGMPGDSKGCCKDEFKVLKLQDSHMQSENLVHVYKIQHLFPGMSNYFSPNSNNVQKFSMKISHSPPLNNLPSLCILNCVFRC